MKTNEQVKKKEGTSRTTKDNENERNTSPHRNPNKIPKQNHSQRAGMQTHLMISQAGVVMRVDNTTVLGAQGHSLG